MPKSRGRRPGSGRSRRPGARRAIARGRVGPTPKCWFDEPVPGDRRSWAVPPVHGTYQDIDLEFLNPDDEDDRTLLMEAMHPEWAKALERGGEIVDGGELVNPRMHVTFHQVVANQLLLDDPPETWQNVQRLADLGYNWHDTMHMISGLVAEDFYRVMTEHRRFDRADYARRLSELPGDWPPPPQPRAS